MVRPTPDDPELPTLGLWLDVRRASPVLVEAATAVAERAMARVMVEHRGVQALRGRWAWDYWKLGFTPYETVCNIKGNCTLRRSWLTRFVRGVAVGKLWLGESLVAQVDPEAAPDGVSRRGSCLEIAVDDDAALDAVERWLAPILPDHDDWQRACGRTWPK